MTRMVLLALAIWCSFASANVVIPVAVAQLIVMPEQFLDQTVRVQGYFRVDDVARIYLGRENAIAYDFRSSIIIEDKTDAGLKHNKCENTWVVVQGAWSIDAGRYIIKNVEFIRGVNGQSCWSVMAK